MNKLLLAMIVGLFAVNTYATEATKAEPAKAGVEQAAQSVKADKVKHTAAPANKASQMKKHVSKQAEEKPAAAK